MIVLNVTYQCRPGMRGAFLDAIRAEGIDAACREEDGNLKYAYYIPCEDSCELLLVEKWRDGDALKAHGAQPHYARLGALKAEYVTCTTVERFDSQA
ncbi:MAG: antibiotic biosynthesis monooxygenase [Clostridia bacterium]|nr:antibiotic biosynthesis monooxygenase [Clostridia bacterium]